MTNQSPDSVIAEVIEYHADAIGSHYDGCYKHHAPCLAVKLRDMLREPGAPDAATAAIERVRDILNRDDFGNDWEHDEWVYRDAAEKKLADVESALDGAPEPEGKPSSTVDDAALADKLKHWIFQYNQERITLKTFARAVAEYLAGGMK